jgi:hypothetical protein
VNAAFCRPHASQRDIATFVEAFAVFTRWMTLVAIAAPLGAVASYLAACRFAHARGSTVQFTDTFLFAAVGGMLGSLFASGVAIAIGALGPDAGSLPTAARLLVSSAVTGLMLGVAVAIPFAFVAAWTAVRRERSPRHQRGRRQN